MTADAPPPLPVVRYVAAARATWTLAAMQASSAFVEIVVGDVGRRDAEEVEAIAAMSAIYCAIIAGLVWLGVRLKRGRGLVGGRVAIVLYGALLLVMDVIPSLGRFDRRTRLELVVLVAHGLSWVVAMTCFVRARSLR